ncbi:hypothetical protein Tco_0622214 [Tanacetum coccineum]
MTDAPRTIIQTTQVIEDTHVIITPVNPEGQQQSSYVSSGFVSNMLNPSPDTGIDSIFNLNTESTSLVDVLVTTIVEIPLLSATTLPPPPIPLITHLQQTPVPTPATVPSSSQQDLPNFGSLFGFDHRLKTLENDFSEFKQTNQFAAAVSLIPSIVDTLRDEAQTENEDFINKLDENIKKIIKDQVKAQVKEEVTKILPKIKKTVNEQIKAEVLTCSSNESKTSHAVAANLSELELKKIFIDKMERNKSIHGSDEQKNLYKALVDAYESDKLILDTYGDIVSFKRRQDDEDKDEEPSAGSNQGSKRRRAGKEPESTSAPKEKTSKTIGKSTEGSESHHKSADKSAQAEEPMHTAEDLEEPVHLEFITGVTEDKPDEDTSQLPDWFQKPTYPPTPDQDTRESFNELMDTPLDFSAFVMNRLKVNTLTPELLASPTFELMKRSCKSLVELEYFFEEVYKATTDQLDWNNPEVTKTKAADYGHIKWIKDLVPNRMWSQVPVSYDKHALWGISSSRIRRLCKMVVECQSVKVKEFQERCNIKAFQEWYEHVGPEVASPQDGKVTRWRRDCAWLMISRCSRSQCQIQVQGTSSIQEVNDHYNIFTRESQEYELKTKDKAMRSLGSPPLGLFIFGDIPFCYAFYPVVAPVTLLIAPVISSALMMVEYDSRPLHHGCFGGLVPYSGSDSDSPDEILASRRVLPCSSDHRSSSSSSSLDSSLVHSSGLDAPGDRLILDLRLEMYHLDWVTLRGEHHDVSSSGDSSERPLHSSSHSAGPSRKRCRSSVDSVSSFTPVMGSLAPTRADILPPRKRDGTEGYEATKCGGMVERDGIVRSFEDMSIDLNDDVRDFYHHMSEVRIDRIVGIEIV